MNDSLESSKQRLHELLKEYAVRAELERDYDAKMKLERLIKEWEDNL